MFAGGIADKLGNRYEAKWLVFCLLEVIEGKAKSIKFEGISEEFTGFEFSLIKENRTEWHQTKINAPSGNWTVNALKNENLLDAFKARLATDDLADCFFVSQDNAKDLRDLTEDARVCENLDQYKSNLAKNKLRSFEKIVSIWESNEAEAFNFLNRIFVQMRPEAELIQTIDTIGSFLIKTDFEIFPCLREYMEENFNKEIKTETIRSWLRNNDSFQIKDWSLDPTILENIANANEKYLSTYIPFGAGGKNISRKVSHDIIEELNDPDGAQLILLTGEAGAGKSGIIREVMDRLKSLETTYLAFRIDKLLDHHTPKTIGITVFDRAESPVITLKGVSYNQPCVLIIDQVDAISEVSGRNGNVKEAIFEMIKQAQIYQGVRVIISCRTFDLENDSRIRNLKSHNQAKLLKIPLLDWGSEVKPLLDLKGFQSDTIEENQKDLLLLPLHLAIFLEIGDVEFTFKSREELFSKLILKKERMLSSDLTLSWPVLQPLAAISNWMSVNQQLDAPLSVLDDYSLANDLLSSENLIIRSGGRISFFHESFFDYIFARTFVTTDQSIVELLLSKEQHLFRRTQVRQILTSLREASFQDYLCELTLALNHPKIRYHIKFSVFQWMSSIKDPTKDELDIILTLNHGEAYSLFLRSSIFVNANWFDLLNNTGWISKEIENSVEARKRVLFNYLSNIACDKPDAITNVLRDWWQEDTLRSEELLIWMTYIRKADSDSSLYELCLDVVRSRPSNIFKQSGRDPISMLIYTWSDYSPEKTAKLLKEIFLAWFELKPNENPFSREGLKLLDMHTLKRISEKAPEVFVEGTISALSKSIQMIVNQDRKDDDWYSFQYRSYSGSHYGFDEFLSLFRKCLKSLSISNPQLTDRFLRQIDENSHECFLHLHLEVIANNPECFAPKLLKIIDNTKLYYAGYRGADWYSFAIATKEAFPYLTEKEKRTIEDKIFLHQPEHEVAKNILKAIAEEGEDGRWHTKKHAVWQLNHSGFEQWCVLNTINASNLTTVGQKKLSELTRKFFNKEIPHPKSEGGMAEFAQSPISSSSCAKMTDQNWITAMQKYNGKNSSENFHCDFGPRELSGMLMRVSEDDPDRYAQLAVKLPSDINKTYFDSLILGLSNSKEADIGLVKEVILSIHSIPDKPFGYGISQLAFRYPEVLQDNKILDVLSWYAENGIIPEGEGTEEKLIKEEILSISQIFDHSRRLVVRTRKGVRGEAWEAIGNSLWNNKEIIPRIIDLLKLRIMEEPLSSVRCSMIRAITPIWNTDKLLFEQLIRDLIKGPTTALLEPQCHTPIITHDFMRLVHHFDHCAPELSKYLINELVSSEDETIHLIGCWWAFCETMREGRCVRLSTQLLENGEQYRSLMAGVAANFVKYEEIRQQATHYLVKFFNDDSSVVREEASKAFYDIGQDEFSSMLGLAEEFIESLAFFDNSLGLFCRLEEATFDVSNLAIRSAENYLNQITDENRQRSEDTTTTYRLQKILAREYSTSENVLNNRTKILNQIDFMLQNEINGMDRVLSENDR